LDIKNDPNGGTFVADLKSTNVSSIQDVLDIMAQVCVTVLQCVAAQCSVLQRNAVRCQSTHVMCIQDVLDIMAQVRVRVLQCFAAQCSVLQRVAVRCQSSARLVHSERA